MKTKKLTDEKWSVVDCPNPRHGPEWKCRKIVDSSGTVILSGLSREAAERHALLPEMARALLELVDIIEDIRDGSYKPDAFTVQTAQAVLLKAGVPLPGIIDGDA